MATEPKRKSVKSETLTIRLDPKTRFMLEFISRLRGQTITTVVERAISDAADRAEIHHRGSDLTWKYFWDVSDGVRALNLARLERLYPTFEEEKLFSFAQAHRQFLLTPAFEGGWEPDPTYMDILWPHIDEYMALWEKTKGTDRWAVGHQMVAHIKAAGVKPPEWPPKPKAPTMAGEAKPSGTGAGSGSTSTHLDDDIPF